MEEVGFYNPLTKQKALKGERIKYWLSVGASPSDTVYNLLVTEKIISGEGEKPLKKRPVHKVVVKKEEGKADVQPRVQEAEKEKEVVIAQKKEEKEPEKEIPNAVQEEVKEKEDIPAENVAKEQEQKTE